MFALLCKKNNIVILISLFILFFLNSCKINDSNEDDNKPIESQWEEIPEFKDQNISYILKTKDGVFVSCSGSWQSGKLYFSSNGLSWEMLKQFSANTGALTVKNDTLFCLSDSLYKFSLINKSWGKAMDISPFNLAITTIKDIIFIDRYLYLVETDFLRQTFRVDYSNYIPGQYDETWGSIDISSYSASKFLKHENKGIIYARGNFNSRGFLTFDGNCYTEVHEGLSENSINANPLNSMAINNDTLFAGFNYPSRIMYLDENNIWKNYADTLPYSSQYNKFQPPLITKSTAIAFAYNKLFVATTYYGVLEWDPIKGWVKHQLGLPQIVDDVFQPVIFLESIDNLLLAGYTQNSVYSNVRGLYRLKLK